MAIIRWNQDAFPTFNRVFDEFFKTEFPEWSRRNFATDGATLPAVNVKESEDAFEIEVAAPGLNKNDFKIEVNKKTLTISAEQKSSSEDKQDNYTRREFSYSTFQRSFTLPNIVDESNVQAKYSDGILHLSLPKKPEAKPVPARLIEVG